MFSSSSEGLSKNGTSRSRFWENLNSPMGAIMHSWSQITQIFFSKKETSDTTNIPSRRAAAVDGTTRTRRQLRTVDHAEERWRGVAKSGTRTVVVDHQGWRRRRVSTQEPPSGGGGSGWWRWPPGSARAGLCPCALAARAGHRGPAHRPPSLRPCWPPGTMHLLPIREWSCERKPRECEMGSRGEAAGGGQGRGSESREERVRVSSAFILWECDWSHWIRDERLKIVGLFGLKWAWFA